MTVTGRLIETKNDEPAVGYSVGCTKSSYGHFRVGDNHQGGVVTDEDGRFEIPGLIAGLVYEMHSANVQRFSNGKNNFTDRPHKRSEQVSNDRTWGRDW